MLVGNERAKQLMMCSMYWGLDMIASLKDLLEDENLQFEKEFKNKFGNRAFDILVRSREVTFLEYVRICGDVLDELNYIMDRDEEGMNTNLEALSFFANQIVILYKDACELLTLLGFEDNTRTMLLELGREVMGFRAEKIRCLSLVE